MHEHTSKVLVVLALAFGCTTVHERPACENESDYEHAERIVRKAQESSTSIIDSLGQSVGRSVTFGLTDVLQRQFDEAAEHNLETAMTAHPLATTAGVWIGGALWGAFAAAMVIRFRARRVARATG